MYLGENRLWVPLLGGKSLPWRVVRPIAGDDTDSGCLPFIQTTRVEISCSKTWTIKFYLVGELPASKYIQNLNAKETEKK